MEQIEDKKQFAVLIDSDNISAKYAASIFNEIENYGYASFRRIYGNWSGKSNGWKVQVLLENSITPVQQFSYTTGKNSTDMAMVIDAMDILYSGKVDGFCLVTSDSDFTRLAMRLREENMYVIGMGKKQTPKAFVAACNRFKFVDLINEEVAKQEIEKKVKKTAAKKTKTKPKIEQNSTTPLEEVKRAIAKIIEDNSDENGWLLASLVGNRLQNKYSDFDYRNYGYKSFTDFLNKTGFETKSIQDLNNKKNPTGSLVYVKIK